MNNLSADSCAGVPCNVRRPPPLDYLKLSWGALQYTRRGDDCIHILKYLGTHDLAGWVIAHEQITGGANASTPPASGACGFCESAANYPTGTGTNCGVQHINIDTQIPFINDPTWMILYSVPPADGMTPHWRLSAV